MKSGIAAVRAHAKAEAIRKEADRIVNAFASMPTSKHRATQKVVRRILLNGPYMLNGRMREIKVKSLGAGIYELSLKEMEEP